MPMDVHYQAQKIRSSYNTTKKNLTTKLPWSILKILILYLILRFLIWLFKGSHGTTFSEISTNFVRDPKNQIISLQLAILFLAVYLLLVVIIALGARWEMKKNLKILFEGQDLTVIINDITPTKFGYLVNSQAEISNQTKTFKNILEKKPHFSTGDKVHVRCLSQQKNPKIFYTDNTP